MYLMYIYRPVISTSCHLFLEYISLLYPGYEQKYYVTGKYVFTHARAIKTIRFQFPSEPVPPQGHRKEMALQTRFFIPK